MFFLPINVFLVGNPISIIQVSSGGFLPVNDTNLQMIEANVLMDINWSYGYYHEQLVVFDGNYTLYNPDNTTEIILAAPFVSMDDYIQWNFSVEVNGLETGFELFWPNSNDEPYASWYEEYFDSGLSGYRLFALCNVTCEGYSNTTVRYSYSSVSFSGTYTYFTYDIGTARAWDGVTTEIVEFRVYEIEPHFYYPEINDTNPNMPIITDIENGKSYKWKFWTESQFEQYNHVGVGYDFQRTEEYTTTPNTTPTTPNTTPTTLYFEYFFSLLGMLVFSLILRKFRFKL